MSTLNNDSNSRNNDLKCHGKRRKKVELNIKF